MAWTESIWMGKQRGLAHAPCGKPEVIAYSVERERFTLARKDRVARKLTSQARTSYGADQRRMKVGLRGARLGDCLERTLEIEVDNIQTLAVVDQNPGRSVW